MIVHYTNDALYNTVHEDVTRQYDATTDGLAQLRHIAQNTATNTEPTQ